MKYTVASIFTFNGKKHEIGEVVDEFNVDTAGIEFLVSQGRLYPIVEDVKEQKTAKAKSKAKDEEKVVEAVAEEKVVEETKQVEEIQNEMPSEENGVTVSASDEAVAEEDSTDSKKSSKKSKK